MIAVRKTLIVALVAALILLAGCTSSNSGKKIEGQNGTETLQYSKTDGTVIIDQITVSNDRIRPGSTIEVAASVQNRNSEQASGVLRIGNTAPLEVTDVLYVEDDAGETGMAQAIWNTVSRLWGEGRSELKDKYPGLKRCNIRDLGPGPRNSFTGERTVCGWKLHCPEDGDCGEIAEQFQDEQTVPITLQLNYNTSIIAKQDSIGIRFLPYQDMDSSIIEDKTYSMENGDIRFKTDYQTPIEETADSFSLTHRVEKQDFTTGTINERILLYYYGAMVSRGGDADGIVNWDSLRRCSIMTLDERQTASEINCAIGIADEPRTDYNYRMFVRANYTMTKTRQHPVTIQPQP